MPPAGISAIVPFVSHVDHTEHDLFIICTEQGLADVRAMDPRVRARFIIQVCTTAAMERSTGLQGQGRPGVLRWLG
jgi:acyl-CoA hydrolase